MQQLSFQAVRSEALFVSALQRSDNPDAGQIRQAITQAVRDFGSRGCAARVAQEFGDHPEAAVPRMRWARQVVDEIFHSTPPGVAHIHRLASPAVTRITQAA
jgi:hypothetical protein